MIPVHKSILLLAIATAMPICLSAQETSTTTTPKSVSKVLTIDSAEVVYASGDDVVLKLPDGNFRLYEADPTTPLIIDGKEANPSDLSPGTHISHVQLHTQVTSDVKSVEQVTGRISSKRGRVLTLRLEDGTTKMYRVPHHATFKVDGNETQFGNITEGMVITVTAVTTEGLTSHSMNAVKVARTPPQQGTLVVQNP